MDHPGDLALGTPLPPFSAHAITPSIPKWQDFVEHRRGDRSALERMLTGYPRFLIHALVTQLEDILMCKEGQDDEKCMLFLLLSYASECKDYLLAQTSNTPSTNPVRMVRFSFKAMEDPGIPSADIYAVFYSKYNYKIAKEFWQHTGFGISSRFAQRCLDLLEAPALLPPSRYDSPSRLHNYHHKYHADSDSSLLAAQAKTALRSRLAEGYEHHNSHDYESVHESDVFLYPTGVSAIFYAHKLLRTLRPGSEFVCFGFMYLDTLKILEKWGPECHFFGHDHDSNLKGLEDLLSSSQNAPPISALFCEMPSNPGLLSPPIDRLRVLADRYDFFIVVDDTIGSSVNVNVLPYADIVVTSLTKFVCRYANAMGGSLVVNPCQRYYPELKAAQISSYDDGYFEEDAIVMEMNSRDFVARMRIINNNANALCEFLHSRSLMGSPTDETFAIKEIFYPKWTSREQYEICRIGAYADGQAAEDNFGGLFSLTFTSPVAAHVFHDTLPCAKGPNLGTNFTLVCPYTILAAEHGIDENLVRVSVGLEEWTKLKEDFGFALREAEKAGGLGQLEGNV